MMEIGLQQDANNRTHLVAPQQAHSIAPAQPIEPKLASLSGASQRAAYLFNVARSEPQRMCELLNKERRHRYTSDNMLEFLHEGELAHMKTKEGVKACDDAIKFLKNMSAIDELKFSETACAACNNAYAPKSSGKTVDALSVCRDLGKIVGAAREILWRGKFSNIDDAVFALLIDDGNEQRTRRAMLLDPKFRYAGIVAGFDGIDSYLLVILLENFAEKK